MVSSNTFLALVVSTLSAVYAAPAATTTSSVPIPSGAAGVTFVPFAGPCEMSTNPYDTTKPEVYNLTSSTGCFTPSYAFTSYVETANAIAANGPCAVSIYSGPDCTGTVHAATLSTFTQCIIDGTTSRSISMGCGP